MNNSQKQVPRDIERSHVMDNALAQAPDSGVWRKKRKSVIKNRFKSPLVTLGSKDGKSFRLGKWKCGHRHNPSSR